MKYTQYLLLAALLLGACNQNSEQKTASEAPFVLTTTGIIHDAVKNLCAGTSLESQSLMGPGVDPHLYKATQRDVAKLTSARIIFYNGLHLEGKLNETLEKISSRKTTVAVTRDINLADLQKMPGTTDAYDPHIWFEVNKWKTCVGTISRTLQKEFPQQAEAFKRNEVAYKLRLDSLEKYIQNKSGQLPPQQRVLVTAHDAFGYFGRAYGYQVRGLQGISTQSDFGLQDITRLVDFIVAQNIRAVFVETSVSPKSIEAVVEGCRARGHTVRIGGKLYSDALGAANSSEGNYIGMVAYNINTITEALQSDQ